MTFLKKLGVVLLKATEIIVGFGPTIPAKYQALGTTIVSDLKAIETIIVQVEGVGQVLGLPGPDKLRAASPLVAQMVLQSSVVAGRKIADPALFQRGAQKIADGMADVLNSLKDDVETESVT